MAQSNLKASRFDAMLRYFYSMENRRKIYGDVLKPVFQTGDSD